jgi:microcystin-dependent protein
MRTFGLPNLQGRTPMHVGNGIVLGEMGGETSHTLNISELPAHTHVPAGSKADPTASTGAGNLWARNNASPYAGTPNTAMNPQSITVIGGNQPHENMSPYLVLNFVIALQGIFPSQN